MYKCFWEFALSAKSTVEFLESQAICRLLLYLPFAFWEFLETPAIAYFVSWAWCWAAVVVVASSGTSTINNSINAFRASKTHYFW